MVTAAARGTPWAFWHSYRCCSRSTVPVAFAHGTVACLSREQDIQEVPGQGEDRAQGVPGLAGAHVNLVGLLLDTVARHAGQAQHYEAALLPAQAQPPGIARVHLDCTQRRLGPKVLLPKAGVACTAESFSGGKRDKEASPGSLRSDIDPKWPLDPHYLQGSLGLQSESLHRAV